MWDRAVESLARFGSRRVGNMYSVSLTLTMNFVFSLLVFLCLQFPLENSSLLYWADRNNVLFVHA